MAIEALHTDRLELTSTCFRNYSHSLEIGPTSFLPKISDAKDLQSEGAFSFGFLVLVLVSVLALVSVVVLVFFFFFFFFFFKILFF
jgi:hypothetical protein